MTKPPETPDSPSAPGPSLSRRLWLRRSSPSDPLEACARRLRTELRGSLSHLPTGLTARPVDAVDLSCILAAAAQHGLWVDQAPMSRTGQARSAETTPRPTAPRLRIDWQDFQPLARDLREALELGRLRQGLAPDAPFPVLSASGLLADGTPLVLSSFGDGGRLRAQTRRVSELIAGLYGLASQISPALRSAWPSLWQQHKGADLGPILAVMGSTRAANLAEVLHGSEGRLMALTQLEMGPVASRLGPARPELGGIANAALQNEYRAVQGQIAALFDPQGRLAGRA